MNKKVLSFVSKLNSSHSRDQEIDLAVQSKIFDFAIVGGGVHGAAFANVAAQYGFHVLLLEKSDYASGTSSRSSKMAHGGLRYLELLDFQQVFEGIKAREELFETLPHIVKPEKFLIPVSRGSGLFKHKLALGLWLYDLMVKTRDRKNSWIPQKKLSFNSFHSNCQYLKGCFMYTDGLLDDANLVMEYINSARMLDSVCLNYAKVTDITESGKGEVEVNWEDTLSSKSYSSKARLVINCSGPWVGTLAKNPKSDVVFSRGTHLIFDKEWRDPSLFLEMSGKSRYYFVWPHPAGTMVGTTERSVDELDDDPLPSMAEVEEILERLDKDLPNCGLNRSSLNYCFAGVRTLPLRNSKNDHTRLSRKHCWQLDGGVLSLFGGKLTTSNWTALEGLKEAARYIGKPLIKANKRSAQYRKPLTRDQQERFIRKCSNRGLDFDTIQRLVTRYGQHLENFCSQEGLEPLTNGFVAGEVQSALEFGQAETLEDVMRRRLQLEYYPGHGLKSLDKILEHIRTARGNCDVEREKALYLKRMEQLYYRMGKSFTSFYEEKNSLAS